MIVTWCENKAYINKSKQNPSKQFVLPSALVWKAGEDENLEFSSNLPLKIHFKVNYTKEKVQVRGLSRTGLRWRSLP